MGPRLARRQFVGVIASGALARIQVHEKKPIGNNANVALDADILSIDATYDDESGQLKVRAEISSKFAMTKLAISYSVSILAELSSY